jgi:hypothetical protein
MNDATTLLGRKVVSVDRTDGAKFVFEDGSWMFVAVERYGTAVAFAYVKRKVKQRLLNW